MESWQLRDLCYVNEVRCRHERKFLVSCLEYEYTPNSDKCPLFRLRISPNRIAGEG